jgi:hypothetical protein
VKSWARFRLVGGISFAAIHRDVTGLTWFARFLKTGCPVTGDASVITRAVLKDYLARLGATGPAPNTSLGYLTALWDFLEAAGRRQLLEHLASDATLYNDDLSRRPAGLPRFVALLTLPWVGRSNRCAM